MTKLLPIALITSLLACTSFAYGQEKENKVLKETVLQHDFLGHHHDNAHRNKQSRSCNDHVHKINYSKTDENSIVLEDFISSDESTDFNCSGGFCMNEDHFHKKGLTIKRQYFYYFVNISC